MKMQKKQNENGNATIILIILLVIVIIAVAVAIFFFVTYSNEDKKNPTDVGKNPDIQVTNPEYYQPTDEERMRAAELASQIRGNIPVMDGSTSTVPLDGGIKSSMLGLSQKIAEANVTHSTTYHAFDTLLEGDTDIIFTTMLSEEQKNKAEEQSIELKIEPVSYEGLVFLVNADNPIEILTQEQIKDIYSGKITNWSEVGGNDAEIISYKRNDDSGIQNLMKNFMQETEFTDSTSDTTLSSAGELMEAITTQENAEYAIGYDVYTCVENMYTNNDKIKMIKVDNIEPTNETISSQEYPLCDYNYAVYDVSKEEATNVDEVVEWLLTYAGQSAIVKSGYAPLLNVQAQEYNFIPCTTLGTGKEMETTKPDDFYYTLHTTEYYFAGQNATILGVQGLNDKDLQETINSFVQESREKLEEKNSEYEEYIDELPNTYSADGINVRINCKNGYLSVEVLLTFTNEDVEEEYVYDGYSKVYDLYTGNELSLSDLYYKDVDFIGKINNQIEKIVLGGIKSDYIKVKDVFSTNLADITIFGLDTITFTKDNPYFTYGVTIQLDTFFDNISVINEERNMQEIWETGTKISKIAETHTKNELISKEIQNCQYTVYYIDTNNKAGDAIVNQFIKSYVDNNKIIALLRQALQKDRNTEFILNEKNQYQIRIEHTVLGNRFVTVTISANPKEDIVELGSTIVDLETGSSVKQSVVQEWKDQNGATE